jgi:hypothetical protein
MILNFHTYELLSQIGMPIRWAKLVSFEVAQDWLLREKKLYVSLLGPHSDEASCWRGVFTDLSIIRGKKGSGNRSYYS